MRGFRLRCAQGLCGGGEGDQQRQTGERAPRKIEQLRR
jgi:hypothetical protein